MYRMLLRREEDVLDIGITEEDIVENELISVPNTLDESVDFEPEDDAHDGESIPVAENEERKNSESEQSLCYYYYFFPPASNLFEISSYLGLVPEMTDIEREDEINKECASRTCAEDNLADDEKHISSEKDKETAVKPTLISLKKHDSKSYDDLPDLSKKRWSNLM